MTMLPHTEEEVAGQEAEDKEREDLEAQTSYHDIYSNIQEIRAVCCGSREPTSSTL